MEQYYVYEYVGDEFVVRTVDEPEAVINEYCVCKMEMVIEQEENGNGLSKMIIYQGEAMDVVDDIKAGPWLVRPIISMPFNWTGYRIKLKAYIGEDELEIITSSPNSLFKTGDKDLVLIIARLINKLSKTTSLEHYNLLKQIESLQEAFSYMPSSYEVSSCTFIDLSNKFNEVVETYTEIAEELPENNSRNLKSKLNAILEQVRKLEIKELQ